MTFETILNDAVYHNIIRTSDKDETMRLYNECQPQHAYNFKYHGHLADCEPFVTSITDLIKSRSTGLAINLFAPCGAGKTCFSLTTLPQKIEDSIVILCVPNAIQAEQNAGYGVLIDGKYIQTVSITGKSGNDFALRAGTVYSTVYDCVGTRLVDIFNHANNETKAHVIMIVDEAHQLYDARSYRRAAIDGIETATAQVMAAGGTVIYLTGTPNKLLGKRVAVEYDMTEVDDQGKEIAPYACGAIEIHHKANHKINMLSYLKEEIDSALRGGKIPMVRYNDKHALEQLAGQFRSQGKTVVIIDSNRKGYRIERDMITGMRQRIYDDPAIGLIQEKSTLPYADLYLCTSILEVGTSIKYILDANGKPTQPKNLVTVYGVNDSRDFSLDSIKQYIARPRFPYDLCVIAMTDTRRPTKDTFSPYPVCIAKQVQYGLSRVGSNKMSFLTPAFGSQVSEDDTLQYDDNNTVTGVDSFAAFAAAWDEYSRQGYQNPATAKSVIEGVFPGISVTEKVIDSITPIIVSGEVVESSIKKQIEAHITDADFLQAVVAEKGLDRKNDTVAKIISTPQGKRVLEVVRRYMQPGKYSAQDAVTVAIAKIESPHDPVKLSDGTTIANPDTDIVKWIYKQIATLSQRQLIAVTNFLAARVDRRSGDPYTDLDVSLTPKQKSWVDFVLASDQGTDLAKLLVVFGQTCTLVQTAKLFDNLSAGQNYDYINLLNRSVRYNDYNTFILTANHNYGALTPKFAAAYVKKVNFHASAAIAEYHAMIRSEKFMAMVSDPIVDQMGVKRTGWYYSDGVDKDDNPLPKRVHYAGGFIGETLHMKDLQGIAEVLPYDVIRLTGKVRKFQYSVVDILTMLQAIFCCDVRGDKANFNVTVRVKSLRKNLLWHFDWAKVSENEAVSAVENIAVHCERTDEKHKLTAFSPEKQIEAILARHTSLSNEKSADSRKNLTEYLINCMPGTMPAKKHDYQPGTVASFFRVEKCRLRALKSNIVSRPITVQDLTLAEGLNLNTRAGYMAFEAKRMDRQKKSEQISNMNLKDLADLIAAVPVDPEDYSWHSFDELIV